ncbi:MAG: DUF4367 domain-containing protein [Clostridiales bacterium]|nr:DUF4367 domain-containing protein [Clostridiales bacterium]
MKNEFDYLNDVKMDFECYKIQALNGKELSDMKKKITEKKKLNRRRLYAAAACIAVCALTGTAFASGLMDNIVKIISTGHNTFVQMDPSFAELPPELYGKVFDKNGVPLNRISKSDLGHIYDSQGNKLDFKKLYEDVFGSDVQTAEKYNAEESEAVYASVEEAKQHSSFDIKLAQAVPEGWILSKIYTYKDENGAPSSDYITLEYKNGEREITVFERNLSKDISFTSGTDGDIEELVINGRPAVLCDGKNLDWESEDNVSVSIASQGNLNRRELIRFAESFK